MTLPSALRITEVLTPHQRGLFVLSGVGLLVVAWLVLSMPSQIGFVLAGPLLILPWGLACTTLSRTSLSRTVALSFSALGLIWPALFLL